MVDVIRKVIPEFALGYHEGTSVPLTDVVEKLREAATTVYTTEKYKSRGEFGELILHLLVRDFHNTIPLVSKIYFKDAINTTVHGFDGVHITVEENDKKLWLGESKLYGSGKEGVKELANDLVKHVTADYLRKEFTLISRKLPVEVPEIDHWRTLMHQHQKLETVLNGVCIPLVCTYTSDLYKNHRSETKQYLDAFVTECYDLLSHFNGHNTVTNVDVLLMLLPVSDKNELNKELDKRLKRMQEI